MAFRLFSHEAPQPAGTAEEDLPRIVVALMGGSASGKTSFFQGIMESMVNKSVRIGSGLNLLLEPIKISRGISPESDSGKVTEEVLLTAPADNPDSNSLFSQMMQYAGGMPFAPAAKAPDNSPVTNRDVNAMDQNSRLAESLKLADQLRQMFTINPDSGFQAPTATVRYVEITFRVTVGDAPKCLLTITDYAGELLDNASADFNSRMVDLLSGFITKSDAVIMLANARNLTDLLEDTYTPDQCMFKEQLTRYTLCADNISAVVRSMRVEGFTILLALTQTDSPSIDERISRSRFSRAQRDLRSSIYEIAFSTAETRHWSYGSIPVTVIGRKRDGSPNVDSENRILPDAVLRQENIDISVLFCLYNAVMRRIMELQKERAVLDKPFKMHSSQEKKRLAAIKSQLKQLSELRSALSERTDLFAPVFDPQFALEVLSETGEVRVTGTSKN